MGEEEEDDDMLVILGEFGNKREYFFDNATNHQQKNAITYLDRVLHLLKLLQNKALMAERTAVASTMPQKDILQKSETMRGPWNMQIGLKGPVQAVAYTCRVGNGSSQQKTGQGRVMERLDLERLGELQHVHAQYFIIGNKVKLLHGICADKIIVAAKQLERICHGHCVPTTQESVKLSELILHMMEHGVHESWKRGWKPFAEIITKRPQRRGFNL